MRSNAILVEKRHHGASIGVRSYRSSSQTMPKRCVLIALLIYFSEPYRSSSQTTPKRCVDALDVVIYLVNRIVQVVRRRPSGA
jgi:hypothetical protein